MKIISKTLYKKPIVFILIISLVFGMSYSAVGEPVTAGDLVEPAAVEPAAEEPTVLEPAAIEPDAEEPAAEEPAAEEIDLVEPAAAEPVAELEIVKPIAAVTNSTGPAVTNCTGPASISVDVDKTWIGAPATNVTYVLQKDRNGGGSHWSDVEEATVQDPWTHTFTYLPEDNYSYRVIERAITGYNTSSSGNIRDGYTFTNTNLEKSVSVDKTWIGKPATDVTYVLQKDKTSGPGSDGSHWIDVEEATVQDPWTHTFTYLPEDNYSYRVIERAITGYNTSSSGNIRDGYTFTNTNLEKSVSVDKTWIGKPATDVTYVLQKDKTSGPGSDGSHWIDVEEATVQDPWTHTFTYLPEDNYSYRVIERAITGYNTSSSGNMRDGYTFINTNLQKSVSIDKTWIGAPSDNVTYVLQKDYWFDFSSWIDIDEVTVQDPWTHTFTYTPELFVSYRVLERAIPGYSSTVAGDICNGYTFTNTRDTIDIPVTKVWEGEAADSITINLLSDEAEAGVLVATGDSLTLNAGNSWTDTFTDLPEYTTDGRAIDYDIEEVSITGYTSVTTGDQGQGFTVTNTRDTIDIPVTKVWEGEAADSITINLLSDEAEAGVFVATGDSLTLNVGNSWTDTFTDLPEYTTDGREIDYDIEEVSITGYTSVTTGDQGQGFTVTNTQLIDITVSKVWDGLEAGSVTFILWAQEGEENPVEIDSITLTAAPWTHIFENIPVLDGITYSITEEPILDYTTEMEYDPELHHYTFTNIYEGTEILGEETEVGGAEDFKDDSPKTGENTTAILLTLLEVLIVAAFGIRYFVKKNQA